MISSPHDIGHVMLIGHAYPDPVVHLCALNCGYTVVQPSHYRVPRSEGPQGQDVLAQVQEFRESLLAIYTTAGLKVIGGERVCMAFKVAGKPPLWSQWSAE